MSDLILTFNNLKTILDAIDYFYLCESVFPVTINFSENINAPHDELYNSIYGKIDSDDETPFTEDESRFILESLIEYRENLIYIRNNSPASSKQHKQAVKALPEVNRVYSKFRKLFIIEWVE